MLYAWRVMAFLAVDCFSTTAHSQNVVTNGGFDGTTYVATFGSVQDTLPSGWSNIPPNNPSSSNVNVVSASTFPGFPDPDGGGHYVAFMSLAEDGSQDCLYQDFPTIPGQAYTLSFKAAMTSASPYLELLPDWDANGTDRVKLTVKGFNMNEGATSSTGPMAFQSFSFSNLMASQSTTRLYFHGVDSQGAILLDSVSVTAQTPATDGPLPLWSLGALGAALLGVAARRGVPRC